MPDPRSVQFSSQIVVGYKDKTADAWDEYGRRPGQPGYDDKDAKQKEHHTALAFQGEYRCGYSGLRVAAVLGGIMGVQRPEDSADSHRFHLWAEGMLKPPGARKRGFK